MVDVARHARHISLPSVGVDGQRRLTESSVLIIGAGGLGSPAALYLAAAGVGKLGLVDNDAVDLSNLQRQILHATTDVGQPKVESAKATLEALDPNVKVEIYHDRLHPNNALDLLNGWDVIIDGTDNLPTRYLIDDACSLLGLPWVYGSVFRFEGQVSLFNHDGGPCYRDLFPEPPPPEAVPTCSEAGVFGVLPGVIGVLQATEAIKLLLGMPVSLSGSLLLYDAQSMAFDTLTFQRDTGREPVNDLSQAAAMLTDEAWCMVPHSSGDSPQEQNSESSSREPMFNHISVSEFLERRESGWSPFILDVRSDAEHAEVHAKSCDLQIPHHSILSVLESLPKGTDIVIHCKSGMRSQLAAMELIQAGWAAERLFNLDGGIMAWYAAAPDDIA
jgi:molybdopterin/thiamine biosynthesis adenylyltransferase/rhodanese-related sulfurtransferase